MFSRKSHEPPTNGSYLCMTIREKPELPAWPEGMGKRKEVGR